MTCRAAAAIPTVTLNDENTIPVIGLGVGELSDIRDRAGRIDGAGSRLPVDRHRGTAYGNEEAVGRAIAASGVPREELFVTTKLATPDQGFQVVTGRLQGKPRPARPGLRRPLPHPLARRRTRQVRRQLGRHDEVADEDGDARSIGVSNFHAEHLSNDHRPVILHPGDQPDRAAPAAAIRQNCGRSTPSTASSRRPTARWASAGCWTTRPSPSVAQAHGKTPAQVLIRWSIQLGNVVIPRSANAGADQVEPRRVRLRADRRRDGNAQRAQRRHPISAEPGNLHRYLTGAPLTTIR